MNAFVYIENNDCLDPAFNLAMEEYVLRKLNPDFDYFMLYRNRPSVIIGRNQNILEEINDTYVRRKNIPVFRRMSGGGTVYHDPGNLNFSFVTRYKKSLLHNFRFFNEPVISVLQSLGVPAQMNDRSDMLVEGKKISGNAQFSSRGRMFSHGTLLFDTRLDELEQSLQVKMNGIRSRSHKSVRSSVANISEFLKTPMGIRRFKTVLLTGLHKEGIIKSHYELNDTDRIEIQKLCDERYKSWDWNIGRTPRFQLSRSRSVGNHRLTLNLEVEKGMIRNLTVASDTDLELSLSKSVATIGNLLIGLRYEPDEIDKKLNSISDPVLKNQLPLSDFRLLIYGDDEMDMTATRHTGA